jgi:outer membrane protein assembly factor BamA
MKPRLTNSLALAVLYLLNATGVNVLAQTAAPDQSSALDTSSFSADWSGTTPLPDSEAVLNPMQKLSKGWPEDLILAPIPGRSPQLGWSLSLVGGYFFDLDKDSENSKPSVVGVAAMTSENDSYFYGAGTYLHLLDDKLRVKAGIGYADVKYRFYGTGLVNDLGIYLELQQKMPLQFVSVTWRVWNRLYAGLGFLNSNVETGFDIAQGDPGGFGDFTFDLDVAAIELPLQVDSRDHEQFPRRGWLVNGRALLYRQDVGSDFDAEVFSLTINNYLPMRERDVLALRLKIKTSSGDTPFFLMPTFGGSTDLRGYEGGRYRDQMMYAVQAEYRWQYSERWIFTGFAGVGEVAPNIKGFLDDYLPAVGVGARFVLSKKHRVGLSVDIARGNEDTQYYFGIGEAF